MKYQDDPGANSDTLIFYQQENHLSQQCTYRSDTQITQDEFVRYKKAQYEETHSEDMPQYMVDEVQNEVCIRSKELWC